MKKVAVLLSLLLVISLVVGTASAAGRASALISFYETEAYLDDSGDFQVLANITASKNVLVLGITTVTIEKKVSGTWRVVETYDYHSHPELRTTNKKTHMTSIVYDGIQSGYDYRAHIVFYASDGSDTDRREAYTTTVRR